MLISDAYADPAPAAAPAASTSAVTTTVGTATPADAGAPSPIGGMGVLLFFVVMMYLFMIRPNQKRIKDYEVMVKSIKRGDRIVTGGGIIGSVFKIENDEVLVVEIAPDVKVRVMRDTVSNIVNKTGANDNKAEDKAGKKSDEKVTS